MSIPAAATSAAPAAVAAAPADFPGWLPPVLVKELRQGLRAKGFVAMFVLFHCLAVLVFWSTVELNSASGLRTTFNWLNGVFWSLLNLVVLLVIPIRGLAGLRVEMDNRTLDLLVLTHLTSWRIVLGKWVALVAQAALFLVALLPYGVVRYFFGSVDLVDDLQIVGWLMLLSGMLIAAALWISAMPKLFRVLMPIGLFFFVQSIGLASVMSMIFSGRGMGPTRSPFAGFEFVQFLVLALLTLVFLGLAVRRLAPPAENHSRAARILAMVLVLGAIVTAAAFGGRVARQAVVFGFAVGLIVAAIEMSRDCLPMRVHWRPFATGARRWFGRLLLPGWPSAAVFAAAALVLLALPAVFVPSWRPPGASALSFAWWLALAWQALLFPALLLSFLPTTSTMRMGGSGYFVIQGLFGTISMISVSNSANFIGGERFADVLEGFCRALPVSSFWLSERQLRNDFPPDGFAGQMVMLVILAWLAWRQSRAYWAQLAKYDEPRPEAEPGASS